MPKKSKSSGTTIKISGPGTSDALDQLFGPNSASKLAKRLIDIRSIIDRVENRAMAVDGPVTNTRIEMTDDELREIYVLAGGKIQA